jgi:hypothetical protein
MRTLVRNTGKDPYDAAEVGRIQLKDILQPIEGSKVSIVPCL